MVVCDVQEMECMVHRCDNCPTYTALQEYVKFKFHEYEIYEDITYSQWDSTDRTTLSTHITPVEEFIEQIVYNIDCLSTHSFIAKTQAWYLKALSYLVSQKIITILCRMKCRVTIGTKTSAPFILQSYIIKTSKTAASHINMHSL